MPYGRAAGRASAVRKATRFALAGLRFDNGVASYLGVLYAENELFDAELSAVRARAERYAELINVYKAFGGGWLDLADLLAAPDRPAAGAAATQSVASPARAP
jgi:multidrug efflux system outer membrane protein